MRLFLITFLFLKIFSPVYANTIYYLTKIPNLEIYDLTASNGIKYLKAEKSFRVGFRENNVQCDKTSKNSIKNKTSQKHNAFQDCSRSGTPAWGDIGV